MVVCATGGGDRVHDDVGNDVIVDEVVGDCHHKGGHASVVGWVPRGSARFLAAEVCVMLVPL